MRTNGKCNNSHAPSTGLKIYRVNSHAHHSCIGKQESCLGPVFPTFFEVVRYSYVKWIFPHFLGKTEVKQGKFVECVSPAKGYFRETYKSQNITSISPTPKVTLGIIRSLFLCQSILLSL